MALNLDLVGKSSEPIKHRYSWKDVVTYALGVGARADELDFLYEGRGPKVLPTFAVVPCFGALILVVGQLGADLRMVLHGEQKVVLHKPIPPSGELSTVATVEGIYDKGKGALARVLAKTTDSSGEPVFDNVFSIFVRGAGGFGGERGPDALSADPPADKAPAFEHVETTTEEQAILYRLSGDLNPLHIDPNLATAVGFPKPILHGLCTYGHAGRAIVKHACGGDPARFKSFAARFAGVVFPGDTITTRGWNTDDGRYVIQSAVADRTVITNSIAEVS